MCPALFTADAARPWWAAVDPRLKLAWVFGISIVVVTVDSPWALAAACFAALIVAVAGLRLRSRGWLLIVGILALTVWGTMLSQGFFYTGVPRTTILTIVPPFGTGQTAFPGIVLSREGMLYGALQSLRLVATALAGFSAALSTSPERMLAALTRLRLPAALAYMTTAALRFLPVLVEEASIVRQARRMRGYRFRWLGPSGERLRPYRDSLGVLLPIIASSLRRAATLADSVTARGFDPRQPRTHYPPLQLRGWEQMAIAAISIGCTVLIVLRNS